MTKISEINERKYPPCIKEMLKRLGSSINLSHAERFALGTFLKDIGVQRDELIDMWRVSPDWDEEKASYQVDDLIKKDYKPPDCSTMKTNGLCYAGDNKLCEKASHPLGYYAMAIWKPPKGKRLNKRK
jgi:DNA primase large subunit